MMDFDLHSLRLYKGGVDATFNLTLFGQPVRNPQGNIISLRFGPGQDAFGRTYIAATSSKGRPVIVLYGASYAATIEKEEGGYHPRERLRRERTAAPARRPPAETKQGFLGAQGGGASGASGPGADSSVGASGGRSAAWLGAATTT